MQSAWPQLPPKADAPKADATKADATKADAPASSPPARVCMACGATSGAEGAALLRCACKKAFFCNVVCQRKAFAAHKADCTARPQPKPKPKPPPPPPPPKKETNISLMSDAEAAYDILETDFPQVSDARLVALLKELQSGRASQFPLSAKFAEGLVYGASRPERDAKPTSDAAALDEDDLFTAGLVAPPAQAQRYATLYAVGCVCRACELLTSPKYGASGDGLKQLAAALHKYAPTELGAPASSDPLAVPEVVVPEPKADGGDDEVWAEESDDDDFMYEGSFAHAHSSASAGLPSHYPARVEPAAPAPTTEATAVARLAHLLGSLSHNALTALSVEAWGELRLSESLRAAIVALREPRWADAAGEGGGSAGCGLSDGALARVLRDHMLHQQLWVDSELAQTLGALPAARRALFLGSLLGGSAPFCSRKSPHSAWAAANEAVRGELAELMQAAETGTAAWGELPDGRDGAVRVLLTLLRWYLGPPPHQAHAVAQLLLSTGAPQMVVRLVLPPPPPPPAGPVAAVARGSARASLGPATAAPLAPLAPLTLGGCWEWLLGACSRYAELMRFVRQVPAFGAALRASERLEARPALRACWLLLLAADERAAGSAAAGSAAALEEAVASVQVLLRDEKLPDATLLHIIELSGLLLAAVTTLRPLLGHGSPLMSELDAFAALHRATKAKATPLPLGKKPPTGAEKREGLLQRTGVVLKQLMQAIRAPGKAD